MPRLVTSGLMLISVVVGDFMGYLHGNGGTLVARNAVTGETMSIALRANWGNITGSFRYVWRPTKSPEIIAGAGLGPRYVRKLSRSIDPGRGSHPKRTYAAARW